MQNQNKAVIDGYQQQIQAMQERIDFLQKNNLVMSGTAIASAKLIDSLLKELTEQQSEASDDLRAVQQPQKVMKTGNALNESLQNELDDLKSVNFLLNRRVENAEYKASEIEEFFSTAYNQFAPIFDNAGDEIKKTLFYELREHFEIKMELIERMA